VEQRTLNPRVGGSSPPRVIFIFLRSKMKSRGFLVLLVLIVAVVYFIFFARTSKKSSLEVTKDAYDRVRVELTQANLATLEKTINLFLSTEGRTPADLNELLSSRLLTGQAVDGWGRSLKYERLSESGFRLVSAGQDGEFGTEDDLVVER
ncbi:MAG: hypothetical protein ACUVV5_03520, partial [Candidatus Aminicenantales bacterium]